MKGVSTGEGWSWKLTSTTARDVAGVLPVGAPAKDIVAAFVADLKLAGVTAIQRRARRRTHCFSVIIGSADSLWVGPFGGAPDCEVTGNPAGCTFNPTITDTEFLPPIPGDPFPYITSIPGLPPAGWLGLGLAIALASRLVLNRSRRAA